jgi:hypothetical protein
MSTEFQVQSPSHFKREEEEGGGGREADNEHMKRQRGRKWGERE